MKLLNIFSVASEKVNQIVSTSRGTMTHDAKFDSDSRVNPGFDPGVLLAP